MTGAHEESQQRGANSFPVCSCIHHGAPSTEQGLEIRVLINETPINEQTDDKLSQC